MNSAGDVFEISVFAGSDNTYNARPTKVDSLEGLSLTIQGRNWAPGTFVGNHRSIPTAIQAGCIGFDFDAGLSLDDAKRIMAASYYGYLIGCTQSHRGVKKGVQQGDRFRIVMLLTHAIESDPEYKATLAAVAEELGFTAYLDKVCKDISRFWFPFKSIEVIREGQRVTPRAVDLTSLPSHLYDGPDDRPAGLPSDLAGARETVANWPAAEQGVAGKLGTGHRTLFVLAMKVIRGHGVPVDQAEELLWETYNPRCLPPWGPHERADFERQVRDAGEHGRMMWGVEQYRGNPLALMDRFFRLYGDAYGVRLLYERSPWGTLRYISDDEAAISRVTRMFQLARYDVTGPMAERVLEQWRPFAKVVDGTPRVVSEESENVDSIVKFRLPKEIASAPPAPWQEFLSRCSSPEMVGAWLYMLTLPMLPRQVLWLLGDGKCGKSEIASTMTSWLGEAGLRFIGDAAITGESASRWLPIRMLGKRLVLIDDTKNPELMRHGLLHGMTGASDYTAEIKGRGDVNVQSWAMFIVTSNPKPNIGRNEADRSRLLLVDVRPRDVPVMDDTWKAKLLATVPEMLAWGKGCYQRHGRGPEVLPDAATLALIETGHEGDDAKFEDLLTSHGYTLDPAGVANTADLRVSLFGQNGADKRNDWAFGELAKWLKGRGCKMSERRSEKGTGKVREVVGLAYGRAP